MIELCYVSSANDRYDDEVLLNLLKKARNNNLQEGVTGLLLYDGLGTFIQALEGEEKTVQGLFERIKRDDMHKRVNVLGIKQVEERSFSEWKMGFRFINNEHLTKTDIQKTDGFTQFLDSSGEEREHIANSGFAMRMLYYFRDTSHFDAEAKHNI